LVPELVSGLRRQYYQLQQQERLYGPDAVQRAWNRQRLELRPLPLRGLGAEASSQ
jgi:hypothetical protein